MSTRPPDGSVPCIASLAPSSVSNNHAPAAVLILGLVWFGFVRSLPPNNSAREQSELLLLVDFDRQALAIPRNYMEFVPDRDTSCAFLLLPSFLANATSEFFSFHLSESVTGLGACVHGDDVTYVVLGAISDRRTLLPAIDRSLLVSGATERQNRSVLPHRVWTLDLRSPR